jgi:DNA-binding response OmpR family regulator
MNRLANLLERGVAEALMNGEHILLIEDDVVVSSVVTLRLRGQGYEVVGAATVPEALRAIRVQMPDLVILDLTLVDGGATAGLTDGFAFLILLRRHHLQANLPVIIHSVDDSAKVRERAKALGVFAVIKKGGPPEELTTAVRAALDQQMSQTTGLSPASPGSAA